MERHDIGCICDKCLKSPMPKRERCKGGKKRGGKKRGY